MVWQHLVCISSLSFLGGVGGLGICLQYFCSRIGIGGFGLRLVHCLCFVLLCYGCSNQMKIGNTVTVTGEEGLLLFFCLTHHMLGPVVHVKCSPVSVHLHCSIWHHRGLCRGWRSFIQSFRTLVELLKMSPCIMQGEGGSLIVFFSPVSS